MTGYPHVSTQSIRDPPTDEVVPFTAELAAVTAQEFTHTVLVDTLRTSMVVVGSNFRFGAGASADVKGLRSLGMHFGFDVDAVEVQTDSVDRLSSTRARDCLARGDVAGAASILGRLHGVTGAVITGEKRGRELGFPTANLACPAGIAVPADGVYAGWLSDPDTEDGENLPAAISIGTNPTFTGEELSRRVEAFVIGREGLDLYDHEVTVYFVERLRGMDAFDSVEALIEEMNRDVARTEQVLGTGR